MDTYKLIPKDKNIFSQLVQDFDEKEIFKNCSLPEVIVDTEKNLWKFKLKSAERLDKKILRDAEIFLSEKFNMNIKIFNIQELKKVARVEREIPLHEKNLPFTIKRIYQPIPKLFVFNVFLTGGVH